MQHLQKTRGRVDIRWMYIPASTPTPPQSLSVGQRSSMQSGRKCQIEPHSAPRELVPCARDLQTLAAGIHQAPTSPPRPCRQPRSRSKKAASLAQPDYGYPMRRESFPSPVRIARQQSESLPPTSLSAPLKTPTRAAPVPRPRPPSPRQAACSNVFLADAHKSARLAPRTRIPRSENEPR